MRVSLRELVGFIIASRVPNLIIIGYVQLAAAYFLMQKLPPEIITLDFGLLIVSTTMIGSAGYIINDYFDQKVDMVNRPEKVVVGQTLRRRLAMVSHLALSATAIALGFMIHPYFAVIHLFSSIVLLLYSSRLKRSLLIGTLAISFLTSLTLLMVMAFYKEINLLVMAYALFGGVAVFVRESIKDIISAKGDQAHGINSLSSIWGIRGAKVVIYIACGFGMIMLGYYLFSVPNWVVRYFFIALSGFIVWFIYRLSIADKKKDFIALKFYIDLIMIAGLSSIVFA